MTIERFSFRPPINLVESSLTDLDKIMVFSKKTNVPPNFKINITPPEYVDEFTLITKARSGEIEDTVGILQRTKGNRSRLEQPVQGFSNKAYTSEGPARIKANIDENTPIAIVAKPCLSQDKKRIVSLNLGEIIIYSQAGKTLDEEKANEALHAEFMRMLKTPVYVER